MKIKEISEYVADVTTLTVKGDRLIIRNEVFERENKDAEWFESCGSTTSLPLDKVKRFLLK